MKIRKVLEEVASGELNVEQALKDIQSQMRVSYSNKITADQLDRLRNQLESYVVEEFFIELDTYEEISWSKLRELIEKHLSEEYLQKVKDLGYEIDRRLGAKFAIHDVSLDYISQMNGLELEKFESKALIKARIHDVNPSDIVSFKEAGVTGTLKQYIKMKIHSVDPEFANKLRELGYEELGPNDLVKLSIHSVTTKYIQNIRNLGLKPTLNEFRKMAIHGVSTSYVEELKNMGFEDISISDLVKSKIHSLEPESIQYYRSLFNDINLREMTKLSIHGIDQEYISEIKDSGLEGLSPKELVKLSNHGVRGSWIKEFLKMGFTDLSTRDYIKAKSHGVSPDYIRDIREAGMDDISLSEIIKFRNHGVYPSYIKKVHEIGYHPGPHEFIKLQNHGVTLAELAHGFVENLDLRQVIKRSMHH